MEDSSERRAAAGSQNGKLMLGAGLVVIGSLMLLDRLFVVDLWPLGSLWPMAVIALGVFKFTQRKNFRARRFGAFLVVVGIWLQAAKFGWIDPEVTWPILVMTWGGLLVMSSLGGGYSMLRGRPDV